MRSAFIFLALLLSASAEEFRVLPVDFNEDKESQMMRAYQRHQVHEALDARLEELEAALTSPESFAAYQEERCEFLDGTFGPLPERTPLNAASTGSIQRDGYRVEKILFESLPGLHVTANLYIPDGDGPFPGVLQPCGHSTNGKAASSYQLASILLAKHGFVVLCFDPLGQGERRQLIGDEPHPILKPRGEHNSLGVAPILLGRTLGAMMVWDGMRAIDYLCSRPEVDPNRIGCTGNSGGGNLTSYLMAFDERIVAAAPGCFMTTHRRKNERPGPGDAEQNLFAQIREGFDHPDLILARAPKPTLILSATHDYVPIEGAWEAFRQAKRAYTVLGHPERVSLVEANEKHGFSKRLREGAATFMARWLQDRRVEVVEEDEVPILSDEELQVTPHGQVRWLPGARSVFEVYAETERRLAAKRPPLTEEVVRKVTGIRPLAKLPGPEKVEIENLDVTPRKLIIHPEPGIVLPALHWYSGNKRPILIAPGDGMNFAVAQARELHAQGHPVLIVEVRDTGETSTRNWRFPGADSYIGQMLGRSWPAMRAEDLLVCARWLDKWSNGTLGTGIVIRASGETVSAALHAGYLEPEKVAEVQVKDGLSSWRELMTSRGAYDHVHQAIHGALQWYDLPDLAQSRKPEARKPVAQGYPRGIEKITYHSAADDTQQSALFWAPPDPQEPVPLLVALHTWSGGYEQTGSQVPLAEWCQQVGWVFIHPDFRGPNWTPEALGSELAVGDIISAVEHAKSAERIDENRIYCVGVSGGGHASLLMAARAPEIWAGVSAWCGIADVEAWHRQCENTKFERYAGHIEKALGGRPEQSEEALRRSPIYWLEKNRERLPVLDIWHGVHDGREGSVPFVHSLQAWNKAVPASVRLSEKFIDAAYDTQEFPAEAAPHPDAGEREVLFRKAHGKSRVSIFEGGHEILQESALNWLAAQRRGEAPNWNPEPFATLRSAAGGTESGK